MSHKKVERGKNRRERRIQLQPEVGEGAPNGAKQNEKADRSKPKKIPDTESTRRSNDLLNWIGVALGFASWGWTALAPESSVVFGSVLLFAAVAISLFGLWRVWAIRRLLFVATALATVIGVGAFDWYVVVKPQRGKAFQDLLVEGYHLTNECGAIPGDTQMPTWMRDQSKGWQSRAQQLIGSRLSPADAQTWQQAVVIGTIKDENTNAYQCLWLGTKVAALETIVATEFEPNLKHRDQVGPTYWLNAVNGEVDVSDVFKSGNKDARIYVNGGGKDNPSGMIKVKGHDLPIKSGTINFQPEIVP
jgi:hypothetical protein